MWTDYIQFLKAGEVCVVALSLAVMDAHNRGRRQRLGRNSRRWMRFVKRISGPSRYPWTT